MLTLHSPSCCSVPSANVHFHIVLDSVKSPTSQLPCTNACVTLYSQPTGFNSGLARGSQSRSWHTLPYDGYHSPPKTVSSRSTADQQTGRQHKHKFISNAPANCCTQGWPAQRALPPQQTENPEKQQVSPSAHWHARHTNE